ncbi:LOW QUALITY PROTEIN: MATH domain and coiled-coil domain-containing protein At3g58410 [Capsella rubella]|uniref:LOW QUALITY PROTEIN: MATH domain and coiled-coil domain-containing protein At3g58410 n=1 Tax=Capsella rubella TaxID=81985 RepID=UPI000CD525DC|nr:LOW QUALITY PROTEIN: MATH domain and coiled-coil domain-containing protein At3g58410 [Capsella rubella]
MVSTPPTEVFAELRFFVYNKKKNKYFTIQDVQVKRFNALKMVWGLQQVLPYDTFINPEDGYIFEGGQCEFGVDVLVAPPLTNWEIISFDEKIPNKFSWTLENLSKLKETVYTSKSFQLGGRKWILKLHPKGDSISDGKHLSLYLHLADTETLKSDEKIFTQVHLRVLDPLGSKHMGYQLKHWHEKSNLGWGWKHFLALAELRKTYLDKDDTLNVVAEFKIVSATKYSHII